MLDPKFYLPIAGRKSTETEFTSRGAIDGQHVILKKIPNGLPAPTIRILEGGCQLIELGQSLRSTCPDDRR